jgi:cytochrome c556
MERIGDHAKKIGEASKAKDMQTIAAEASAINDESKHIEALFPAGSTHEHSRAKPEIWENWKEFQGLIAAMQTDSAALAEAARSGGDVGAASKKMFGGCKSCHDKFRKPEKRRHEK